MGFLLVILPGIGAPDQDFADDILRNRHGIQAPGITESDIPCAEIQQNYPFAYEVACRIRPIAEQVLGYHLLENELSRLAVRLVVAMDEIPQRKRTLVIVDSASYSELLRFKLRHYFSRKIEFLGTCPAYQLEKLLKDSPHQPVELILTTTSLIYSPGIDTLHISPILNQQDINLLNDYFFRNNRSYRQ